MYIKFFYKTKIYSKLKEREVWTRSTFLTQPAAWTSGSVLLSGTSCSQIIQKLGKHAAFGLLQIWSHSYMGLSNSGSCLSIASTCVPYICGSELSYYTIYFTVSKMFILARWTRMGVDVLQGNSDIINFKQR